MARNIEIKAHVSDLATIRTKASLLASGPSELIEQTDTFFVVPKGRLKIREFSDGSAELIAYDRPNQTAPNESNYTRVPCNNPSVLSQALSKVLSVRGQVRKRREVFIVGRTRVHLDQVENLGSFVELEVVLRDGESVQVGEREAQGLMDSLAISPAALVSDAYIDLLEHAAV